MSEGRARTARAGCPAPLSTPEPHAPLDSHCVFSEAAPGRFSTSKGLGVERYRVPENGAQRQVAELGGAGLAEKAEGGRVEDLGGGEWRVLPTTLPSGFRVAHQVSAACCHSTVGSPTCLGAKGTQTLGVYLK